MTAEWVPIGDGLRLLVRKVPCLMGETFGTRFGRPPRWKHHDPLRGTVLEPDIAWVYRYKHATGFTRLHGYVIGSQGNG